MRESEEYLEDKHVYNDYDVVDKSEAEHAVKLAYKEGYLEARADILEELRLHDSQLFMVSAICRIKEMKLPENLFK